MTGLVGSSLAACLRRHFILSFSVPEAIWVTLRRHVRQAGTAHRSSGADDVAHVGILFSGPGRDAPHPSKAAPGRAVGEVFGRMVSL